MAGTTKKATAMKQPHINPLESLSGLGRFFLNGAKDQVIDQGIKQFPTEVLKQVGAIEAPAPRSGEMKPGQEVNLNSVEKSQGKPKGEVLGGIDYRREIVHGSEKIRNREVSLQDRTLQELRAEIARLASSVQAVSKEAQAISVEQAPQAAGKYHQNFMEWMLSVIRTARMKVEDSGAWLQVSKKKNGYSQKAKNLGTKFTLSQERTVATQTG
jgi:hypothetical protein